MEHSAKFNELEHGYKLGYVTKATLQKWVKVNDKKPGMGITRDEYKEITGEDCPL